MSLDLLPHIIASAPENLLRLTFENGIEIEPGAELASDQIKFQPELAWDAELDELYTILLVDSIPAASMKLIKNQRICHWMVVNIPGNEVHRGKVIIAYHGAPLQRLCQGVHRFICLVFKQTDRITTENFIFKITNEQQIIVKTNDYKTKRSLGIPVAGNYYNVRDLP